MKKVMSVLFVLTGLTGTGVLANEILSIGDVVSIQLREDGQFSVACRNGTFEVVSGDDVLTNNLCPYHEPPNVEFRDGLYRSVDDSLCEMKASAYYDGSTLKRVRLDYPECTGSFLETTCAENVCTGTSYSQTVRITLTSPTTYTWENVDYYERVDFERVEQEELVHRPLSALPRIDGPVKAGQRLR